MDVLAVFLLPNPETKAGFESFAMSLDERFGVRAARRLPTHVTLKGFFYTNVDETEVAMRVARSVADEMGTTARPVVVYDGSGPPVTTTPSSSNELRVA